MWPVMHPCGIATLNCSEFDRAFDQYGVIKRQCTKEGVVLASLADRNNIYMPQARMGLSSYVHISGEDIIYLCNQSPRVLD